MNAEIEKKRRIHVEQQLQYQQQQNDALKDQFTELVIILSRHPDFRHIANSDHDKVIVNVKRAIEKSSGPVDGGYIIIPDENFKSPFEQNSDLLIHIPEDV